MTPDDKTEIMAHITAETNRLIAALAGTSRPTGGQSSAPATTGGGNVASDADLDSQWGDPEIRKDPPRWSGASYAGQRYSRCPVDYLETLAGFLDWKAGKDEEKGTPEGTKYAGYARKDAARARGWAKRNAANPPPVFTEGDGNDLPF